MTGDEKRLIIKALHKLQIVDAMYNQPLVKEIQGILYELLSRTK